MANNINSNPIANLVWGTGFIAIGIAVFVYWGKPTLENSQASKNWPTVSGVVKTSEVSQSKSRDSNSRMYSPHVTFEYEVDGHTFVSSKVAVSSGSGWSSSESSSSYQVVNKYPQGSAVKVAYDPEDPSYAVLETGTNLTAYIYYYLGPVFVGLGLLMVSIPLVKIVFVICFLEPCSTSTNPQSMLDSRFPEENSLADPRQTFDPGFPEGTPSPVHPSASNSHATGAPVESSSKSNIGEGITIH